MKADIPTDIIISIDKLAEYDYEHECKDYERKNAVDTDAKGFDIEKHGKNHIYYHKYKVEAWLHNLLHTKGNKNGR